MLARNPYLEAVKENNNVIGLTVALALSAATLSPLPILAALVAEAAYLVFVPDSKWYEARLSKRYDAEVQKRRDELKQQILPTLRPVLQARFMRLEEMRQQIGAQALDDQTWFREVLRKLDFLLEKFLQFAGKEVQFRAYLETMLAEERNERRRASSPNAVLSTHRDIAMRQNSRPPVSGSQSVGAAAGGANPPARVVGTANDRWVQSTVQELQASYDENLQEIQAMIDQEQDTSTKAVLIKRLEVLQRRREFIGKIGKILSNLNHQLELLEDTFGLISDEICARSPEQVLTDIDDVVSQTNTMTQLLDEVAPFESSMSRLSLSA